MTTATTTGTIVDVDVADIVAGDNDRQTFDPDAIARLAGTIEDHGLLQPITVRPRTAGGFEIVAGERRFRAVTTLGWDTIPAIVRPLDDAETADMMLVENTGRVDLNPVEEGRAYAKRIADGATVDEVARKAGVSATVVRYRVDLLDLVPEALSMVAGGGLTVGMARLLDGLDANRQRIALRAMAESDLTWYALRDLTDRLRDDQFAEGQGTLDFDLVVEEAVEQAARERSAPTRRELVDALAALTAEQTADTSAVRNARDLLARL